MPLKKMSMIQYIYKKTKQFKQKYQVNPVNFLGLPGRNFLNMRDILYKEHSFKIGQSLMDTRYSNSVHVMSILREWDIHTAL